jgi:hypothetical protein
VIGGCPPRAVLDPMARHEFTPRRRLPSPPATRPVTGAELTAYLRNCLVITYR